MALDKNLLFLTSESGRLKIREISKLLGKSSQRLKYSLQVLQKKTIIQPHTIIDYSYFGLLLFRVYFKSAYITEKDKEAILKRLDANKYITAVYELSGEFDLVLEFMAPNPSRFNKEFKKIVQAIPTFNNYKIILNIVTHLYPRLYLPKDQNLVAAVPAEIIVGGDRSVEDFSSHEQKIIELLLLNPLARQTRLAKLSQLNVKTVKGLFNSLRKRHIIKGFKYLVNSDEVNIYKSRLFLRLHNLTQEAEKKMMDYLLGEAKVVGVNKTVGDWDLEIDLESMNRIEIRILTLRLRENFKEYIETFNIMEFHEYYRISYLPKYLFEMS
jgi:DNA-binding Lrp family transcriptional regulator